MRYTHHFKIIRKRKNALPISIVVLLLILSMILIFGFSKVDASQFIQGFILSLIRVLIAYALALILAIIIAFFVISTKFSEDLLLPILDALQSFPAFSLVPLLIVWFGQSSTVAIIILVIEMIWPILFSVVGSFKSIREDLTEAATIFGATGFRKIIYVVLPLSLPAIATGSIVAWGEAWETVLAAEIIIKIPGVGNYLSKVGDNNQSSTLIIGILLLLIILFILNKFIWIPLLNVSTKYQQE